MERILVGKILRAHGLLGSVRVFPLIDDIESLTKLKHVFIEDSPATVVKVVPYKDYAYVTFSTITDRNQADMLMGKSLYAYKDEVHLHEGQYFIDDVIGCEVRLDDGTLLGKLCEIMTGPMIADIYVVDMDGKSCRFPFVKKLDAKVDVNEKTITLSQKAFDEVVLYDD